MTTLPPFAPLAPVPLETGTGPPGLDHARLRDEGIRDLIAMASASWTDFNSHDPGVTTLEALCYALTELAHQATLPIEDIIASLPGAPSGIDAAANQAFFSARTILTTNPITVDDLRRALIDIDDVRNAWVRCRACSCAAAYYAWCEDGELRLAHDPAECSVPGVTPKPVSPRGLYDVTIVLESDPELGDLNSRKVEVHGTLVDAEGGVHPLVIELRIPRRPIGAVDELARPRDQILSIGVHRIRRSVTATTDLDDDGLRRGWNGTFVLDLDVTSTDGVATVEGISMRLLGSEGARRSATAHDVRAVLDEPTLESIADRHRAKQELAARAMSDAKVVLNRYRNLDEDVCHVETVEIEDIAVCAAIEVEVGVDIEEVQAAVWFTIEQAFDPPIPFRTVGELVARGMPSEEIFNGPKLANGFVTDDDLAAASAKAVLRVSDLVNALMDIEGVLAVEDVLLTGYDTAGEALVGMADPDWDETDGTRRYDATKVSASWELALLPGHQPRFAPRLSRIGFTKSGLPFTPRSDEVDDVVTQLRGAAARPKIPTAELDLPVPGGTVRQLGDCFPVQYSFPLAYGIGPFGLPDAAPPRRHAQAKQFKGYLMVFEQLLRDRCAQLAHLGDLFSLDRRVDRTTFSSLPGPSEINGYAQLVPALTSDGLQDLEESPEEFVERRNRFLDHLLARFGERFDDHPLLAANRDAGRARAALIDDKIELLRAYPVLSHDRPRAFDRRVEPCAPGNVSGLERRVRLLLGSPDHRLVWRAASTPGGALTQRLVVARQDGTELFDLGPVPGLDLAALATAESLPVHPATWELVEEDRRLRATVTAADGRKDERVLGSAPSAVVVAAIVRRQREALRRLGRREDYQVASAGGALRLRLPDQVGHPGGSASETSATEADAHALREELIAWSALVRAVVVEHLLLRPKFPGDALLAGCCEGGCPLCGTEDPYSFRLTFVMPGWLEPYATDPELRRFVERTIRQEAPSHLLVKVCWVGNDGDDLDECAPIVDEVAGLLDGWLPSDREHEREDSCRCAAETHRTVGAVFRRWYEGRRHTHLRRGRVADELGPMFSVALRTVPCASGLTDDQFDELSRLLAEHFAAIAVDGFQFERFEDAWCDWLDLDAPVDWTVEQLQPLTNDLLAARAAADTTDEQRCVCVADLLASVGGQFAAWVDAVVESGAPIERADPFEVDVDQVASCAGIAFDADAVIATLRDRYRELAPVSIALRILGERLCGLRDTYPAGTLHDCDDAGERNPIRLGQTALGSNFHDH